MTSDHLLALPEGHEVEGYRIERVLGAGGFGITYLAVDLALEKRVALKEYLPADTAVRHGGTVRPRSRACAAAFREGCERFLTEARTLARFRHPHIIRVHRIFEAHGTAYLVMDYEAGDSLEAVLRRQGAPPAEALLHGLLVPLLDGLSAVHEAGFLHRDIKPDNIYLRHDGSPVLLDFGAARQATGAAVRSLTIALTPGYAPPEQYASDHPQGPWSDIYALGAVLYRAITGTPPAEATSRLLGGAWLPAAEAGRGRYSDMFLSAIDAALAIRAEERPASIEAWRALFGPLLAPAPVLPAAEPRSWLMPALAASLVAMLGGLGFASWQTFEETRAVAREAAEQILEAEHATAAAEEKQEAAESATPAAPVEAARRENPTPVATPAPAPAPVAVAAAQPTPPAAAPAKPVTTSKPAAPRPPEAVSANPKPTTAALVAGAQSAARPAAPSPVRPASLTVPESQLGGIEVGRVETVNNDWNYVVVIMDRDPGVAEGDRLYVRGAGNEKLPLVAQRVQAGRVSATSELKLERFTANMRVFRE